MKHGKQTRVLALALVFCLSLSFAAPAYAAGGARGGYGSGYSISDWFRGIWERIGRGGSETPSEPDEDLELTLVEDETTVTEGTQLRASTYAAGEPSAQAETTTLKYFPVTLYDYDATTINNATHQKEVDAALAGSGISSLTQWNGIYFSSGAPGAESYTYTSESGTTITAWVPVALADVDASKTYVLVGYRGQALKGNYSLSLSGSLSGSSSSITGTATGKNQGAQIENGNSAMSGATEWTISKNGDYYRISASIYYSTRYMTIGNASGGVNTTATNLTIEDAGKGDNSVYIGNSAESYWLNQEGGATSTNYTGWNDRDDGSRFYIYELKDVTTTTGTTGSLEYAAWNWWNKKQSDKPYGQYTYSGLVNSTLDANKNISFTKPDGGIFNSDATVKTIYTNVEMPFVYKDGTYTFDASQNGVYFSENSSQSSTKAQSNGRLYFNAGKPQTNGGSYGDGSSTVWMPFNSTQNIESAANCNYHFGMAATIPFTMTANGKMNPNDDTSEDITFSFSGDDDVWVFIDGQLVIDLGGIHNRLDATINFAENTWKLSASNTTGITVADTNGAAISGTLFNANGKTGTLNQTRETFAAKDSHELTIFYLERGAGASNCKIVFNLPMKDVVSVTKRATQSISSDGTVSPLTAAEQAVVDNIDFGFTLTKNGTPVANTNYNLLNANGQVIDTPSTDAKGHFTLKNGQTARFIGEIAADGAEYKVVEDIPNNVTETTDENGKVSTLYTFSQTVYTYGGTAAGGYTVGDTSYKAGSEIPATTVNIPNLSDNQENSSVAVTAKGSTEAEDSLQFICENYFNANLPNPSSRPVDDQIVIDYGLPVVIDVLANDAYRGDKIEITSVTGKVNADGVAANPEYGTATVENGKITYQLTKQLTGVEVLTYTAKVTGKGNEGGTTTTDTEERTANVYIIPATSMYYEEDFIEVNSDEGTSSSMVTYVQRDGLSKWSSIGNSDNAPQEPGVVGTNDDSPYGSDAAYLNDSGDSNGTSMYVNTANTSGAIFSYTFTGTGTSFFARTTNNSGYMLVTITNEDGEQVYSAVRDTSYKTKDNSLIMYNIPVFTYDADNYGTYTVKVSLAGGAARLGTEFWLDGIRIIDPLGSTDETVQDNADITRARAAYAADGEAGMVYATLRDKLIGEADTNDDGTISWKGGNFVIFTDTNGEVRTVEEYTSNGPKEEVYLSNGQSVTFSLTNWDTEANKIYLGIKAPVGDGSVSINGNALSINNTTDCYYEISRYAAITTDAVGVKTATFKIEATSSLISVTNIKVTGNPEFTIVNGENVNVNEGSNGDPAVTSGEIIVDGDDSESVVTVDEPAESASAVESSPVAESEPASEAEPADASSVPAEEDKPGSEPEADAGSAPAGQPADPVEPEPVEPEEAE